MKDKGIVVSADRDLARVKVECLAVCHDCSARLLCGGEKNKDGILAAKNPVRARPGDSVSIDVPESRYNRTLLVMFSSFIIGALSGMGLGYALSRIFLLPTMEFSSLGLVSGLVLTGAALIPFFKKENKKNLYPTIVRINEKGERHG
jgi:positive regulator of sigma E activity